MAELDPSMRVVIAAAVFAVTYVGMALGRLPGLRIDRTGIALIAAVALVVTGVVSPADALAAIDFPTLCVLLGLMVVSAQFGLAGFYDWCAARIALAPGGPVRLLGLTVLVAGGLSAVLVNDIVVFAMTPILCRALIDRGLDPRPYLVAMAAASNAGSAATIIGNPQNILIGEVGRLDFVEFVLLCGPLALVSLAIVFVVTWWIWRRSLAAASTPARISAPALERGQTGKGLVATMALIIVFAAGAPRAGAALAIAAVLLVSRRHATRTMMAAVDWHLILLFACLFVVNRGFDSTGLAAEAVQRLAAEGMLPDRLIFLTPLALAASNTIGNVPAVIMILAHWPAPPAGALHGLALLSTLAGNLFLVGSIANLIVAERARAEGVRFGFADHARAGVPITLLSLALAVAWLGFGGWMAW